MTSATQSDAALEQRAVHGDVAAFGLLARRWDDGLRAVAWSVTRSHDATGDVVQATYVKAIANLDRFEQRSSLRTWVHSICYRTALDHLRRADRHDHETLDAARELHGPQSTSGHALARHELAQALEALNPEHRSLLMMVAGLGYSFDEVAQITGLARGTVASRVARCRAALRAMQPADDQGGPSNA